jgi:3-deoxy-D-manno-octulosonic-acid transferase
VFIVVTFFSPSGFEHYHKRTHPADCVCYLPLDTPQNAQRFMAHFHPEKVFLIKYEFWKNYIIAAKNSGAKVYSISTLFRPDHRFFKWYGENARKTLRAIDFFFVQNEISLKLLQSIHIKNALITGDTRFDRVIENKQNVQQDAVLADFLQGEKAFVIGSSWAQDEEVLKTLIYQIQDQYRIIIAPHEIGENHLQQIEKMFSTSIFRYSQTVDRSKRILLIDCIGKLANAYSYGEIAYVGGGFSGSLHNILEPAVFGLPVIFGPKHKRFPEASTFIQKGVGFSISDTQNLIQTWEYIQLHKEHICATIQQVIEESTGATDNIINHLKLA